MKDYKDLYVREKKAFWKENPVRGDIDIMIEGIQAFKMHCDNDDTVVKELYWTSFTGWEFTSLMLWRGLLNNFSEGVVYDIGAYSGIYSLIASVVSSKYRVEAFDIQPKCIDRVSKNMAINSFENIEVTRAACSSENGKAPYFFYDEEGIISSVAGLKPKSMNNLQEEVATVKLDDHAVAKSQLGEIRLIKIDVEGAEKSTLAGMQNILNADSPDVLIEVNDFKDLKGVKKLFPKTYSVYDIDEDQLVVKKLNWLSKPSEHRNYLFTIKSNEELQKLFMGIVK